MSNQHSKCDDCYKTHLPEAHDRTILPSEAFGEGYVPEFNQASDGKLKAIIERYVDRTAVLAEQDCRNFNNKHLLKLDMGTAIETIIITEKLKLLDEVIHQSTINLKSAKAVAGWAEIRKEQLEAEL